jgi:hypothetical protein
MFRKINSINISQSHASEALKEFAIRAYVEKLCNGNRLYLNAGDGYFLNQAVGQSRGISGRLLSAFARKRSLTPPLDMRYKCKITKTATRSCGDMTRGLGRVPVTVWGERDFVSKSSKHIERGFANAK